MLHIILVILKIMGILLACILLLLLLGILLVLFVPLRYELEGSKEEKVLEANAQVNWLCRMAAVTACYEQGKLSVFFRILFWKKFLFPSEQKKKSRKQKKPKKKKQKKELAKTDRKEVTITETEKPAESQTEVLEEKPVYETETANETEKLTEDTKVSESEEMKGQNTEKAASKSKLAVIKEKLAQIRQKILEIPEKIRQIREKIAGWIKKGSDGKEMVRGKWELFRDSATQAVIARMKQRLWYLWKHFRPRKLEGRIHFGMKDPATTGKLTGMCYLLLPENAKKFSVEPDFEQAVIEGKAKIKGHIRICHVAWVAWKVFRDKEFRKLLKEIMK